MNAVVTSILWWGVVWTVLGSAIFAATQLINRGISNAAARHVGWVTAFGCVWLFPAYVLATVVIEKAGATQCATLPPGTPAIPFEVICLVIAGWFGGAAFTMVRALMARRMVNRWYAKSIDYRAELKGADFVHLPVSFPKNIELRLAAHDEPAVPITWGTKRPVVLLPKSARNWESARLTAVLLHEFAHIRRFDNLTQLVALITCAFHWFNPLFWYGARRMEAESEIAADDFAILRGVKPSNYARELLSLASEFSADASDCAFAQTAMIKPFSPEQRLHAIINPGAARGPMRLGSVVPIAAIFLGAILTITLLTPRVSGSLRPKAPAAPSCLPPVGEGSV